ncbi:hypothetical protein KHA80_02755 [Anaerobacillus sp. HL2]|nr:hypothetical protein KHA80_02755 [Anaerobacillus sp. HL2]
MTRGFSLAYTHEEKLIKSVTDVSKGDELKIKLKDGSIFCHVENIEKYRVKAMSDEKELSFEEAIEKLEEVVDKLEKEMYH